MTSADRGGLFAWHRWKLGWLDDGQVVCDFVAGAPANVGSRGMPIRLRPARSDDVRGRDRCGYAWRAPYDLGRAGVARAKAFGIELRLVRALPDGSYRVSVMRT